MSKKKQEIKKDHGGTKISAEEKARTPHEQYKCPQVNTPRNLRKGRAGNAAG